MIDGVRGVALKVEASGYFAALLPAGALELCTPRTLVGTAPVEYASPAVPTPTATSPESTPIQSGADRRSEPERGRQRLDRPGTRGTCRTAGAAGQGAVVVVTPADIAAAAQAAGLKPQSLKLALMHRPGCRMTPDGGAAVAAE